MVHSATDAASMLEGENNIITHRRAGTQPYSSGTITTRCFLPVLCHIVRLFPVAEVITLPISLWGHQYAFDIKWNIRNRKAAVDIRTITITIWITSIKPHEYILYRG